MVAELLFWAMHLWLRYQLGNALALACSYSGIEQEHVKNVADG